MTPLESRALWDQVKENNRKISECQRHRFNPVERVLVGQKFCCQNCQGVMGLIAIGDYIAGYKAGGGDVNDIWPGYERKFNAVG